jgi:hypothetical protein
MSQLLIIRDSVDNLQFNYYETWIKFYDGGVIVVWKSLLWLEEV